MKKNSEFIIFEIWNMLDELCNEDLWVVDETSRKYFEKIKTIQKDIAKVVKIENIDLNKIR